jgi:hypothetical protein
MKIKIVKKERIVYEAFSFRTKSDYFLFHVIINNSMFFVQQYLEYKKNT